MDDSIAPGQPPGRAAAHTVDLPIAPDDRYDVVGEHARGGLGVILRATDVRLARPVAIKELGDASNPRAQGRFIREAMITARLQHPGIVPVYDAARWPDGAPYYAMKLVSGRTLGAELAARPALEGRLALLPSVLAVAEAVGYAHAEGVIHRDLKPDNVMIGTFGETVVLDWGLAKDRRLADTVAAGPERYALAATDATRTGAVLGTPGYMAPEQARGEDVDERADVWAIGAILYHVLAAAPPFEGASSAVIARVAAEPPPPLAARAPGAPRDLLAMVDKAMARDPGARYPTAKQLADDLSRFLTGQLVGAREYGRTALVGRWVRRHRAAVSVAAILLAILGATVAVSIQRILDERQIARTQRDELLLTQARSQLDRDPTAALAWSKQYPADGADPAGARAVIADASSRAIARHVWRDHPEYVGALTVAGDGAVVASAGAGVCQLWDARTGRRRGRFAVPPVSRLALARDGSVVVAAGRDGSLTAIQTATLARRTLGKAGSFITALAILPDDRAVVTGDLDGVVQLWPLDGSAARELTRHRGGVYLAEVIEHGAAVASLGNGDLELRRVPLDGSPATPLYPGRVLQGLPGDLGAVAIGRDARLLAIGIDDRVLVWALGAPAPVEQGRHRAPVKVVAVSDAGEVASGAEDGSVMSWPAGAAPRVRLGHHHAITALAFGGDGRLASGDTGGDVRVWAATAGELLRGHDGRIESLVFDAGGTLYSAGGDRSVRAWPARAVAPAIQAGTASVFGIAFVAPGAIAATNEDGSAYLISLATGAGRKIGSHARQAYWVRRLPEGRFATSAWDGIITVYRPDGDELRRFDHGAAINGLAASPDGAHLASTGDDGSVRLWDVATGAGRVIERRADEANDVVFSPDGRTLVTSGADHELHAFDLPGGGPPRRLLGHTDVALSLTFSRDGKTLFSAGGEGLVRGWDLATGTSRAYPGHDGRVRTLALSPDQRILASGGSDGTIRIWDLTRPDLARVLRGHTAEVRHVVFSPDGAQLASAGWDGTVRLWRLGDGSVTVWRADDDKVQRVEFSPDGKLVASAGADGTVRLWSVDGAPRIPSEHEALASWLDRATTATISASPQVATTPP